MKHSRQNSQDRFSTMLDNTKTTAHCTMPSASGLRQASNGILIQDSAMACKKEQKLGSDSQCGVHAQYVLQLLQLQRQAGFLCDITIHVKDRSFKAHKPLLAACSLYFRALFANDTTKESTALSLTSLTPSGFEVLLDYIYSGSLAITPENSSEVLSAATCLQMTNVVETCLSFMRSSFRMSKHKELSLSKRDQDDISNRESGKSLAASDLLDNIVRQSIKNTVSPALARSTSKNASSSQSNIQILSTKSINETEFKNMLKQDSEHCGTTNTSTLPVHQMLPLRVHTSTQAPSSQRNFTPSIPTQGQLTRLTNSDNEPQLVLNTTSSPNVYKFVNELRAQAQWKIPESRNSSQATVSIETSTEILPDQKFEHSNEGDCEVSSCSSSQQPLEIHVKCDPPKPRVGHARLDIFNSREVPSGQQNSEHLSLPLSINPSVSSVKDRSSISPAAVCTSPPERYSGIAPTAKLTTHLTDTPNLNDNRIKQKDAGVPAQYSSDEQANSVEISSDDESRCSEWGGDRSAADESRDLSGTPYSAAVNLSSSDHSKTVSNDSGSKPAPVAKTKSLPSLTDTTRSAVERARSLDEGKVQTITYEKATKAISALSRSEWVVSSSQSDDNVGRLPDILPVETESKQFHESNEEIPSDPVIASEVFRKTLLPKRHERNVPTPRSTVSLADRPATADDVCSGDIIKVESNDESEPGAFPLSDHIRVQALKLASEPPGSEDDNALDLSVPKCLSRSNSIQTEELPSLRYTDSAKGSSRRSSEVSNLSDPGMALAVDALSLLKHSKSNETSWPTVTDIQTMSLANASQSFDTTDNFLEDANHWNQQVRIDNSVTGTSWKQTSYSRKPRRTAGGQTCTWPGCGRLFRHRNIYEEHQRLHELGIPVSQLRKCYMGARVKKTVREQLEELRTNDNVFDGNNDLDSSNLSRARKRKSLSDSQEPIRKRVHVKDRAAPFHHLNPASAGSTFTPKSPVSHSRVRHSLSNPFSTTQTQSSFLRAPLPPPLIPNSQVMKIVGSDGVVRFAPRLEYGSNQRVSANSSAAALSQSIAQSPLQPPPIRISGTSTSQQQMTGVNPVQQTLALLGIRTPMRRLETGDYAIPISSVATNDQIRRRMAIRETTALGPRLDSASTSQTVSSVPPPTFDPDAVRARLVHPRDGYQILSRDSSNLQGGAIQLHPNQPHSGPPYVSG